MRGRHFTQNATLYLLHAHRYEGSEILATALYLYPIPDHEDARGTDKKPRYVPKALRQ